MTPREGSEDRPWLTKNGRSAFNNFPKKGRIVRETCPTLVDMPVFFYIDPEFAEDPKLENVNAITLSYTFFEARDGLQLPLPGYSQPHNQAQLVTTNRLVS